MGEVLFFQMPEMNDDELRSLFGLIIPEYISFCCIACGYHNEIPIAIVATNNDKLVKIISLYSNGVKEINAANIPKIKYHLSGENSLWTLDQIELSNN